ncbi:hypothetical protein BDP27DRAFT_1257990 [Rhodocollybia butyracea]|uniref:Uncharacterized protein n=1 Tax=Rhodocollybia butyracea TaxID=206335 RepID=A0A9P5UD54_9AGAR|nr:hypothetical protein BDP27DRAFT_1257990 [Rhodocollybia butyracea]
MSVKVHTHASNREKPGQPEKKVVFKGVLDNPFRILWPSIPINLQNVVLAQVISLLDGVSEYQSAYFQANRKRKREQSEKIRPRKKKATLESDDRPVAVSSTEMQMDIPVSDPPEVLSHLVTGINTVTKRLETLVRTRRGGNPEDSMPNVKIVLVCRADVNPPMLIDHLPHLVAAYNSTNPPDPILLVPLPPGAEFTLAEVMGVRRVAVMAIDKNAPGVSNILSLIADVPILTASWLSTQVTIAELKRTSIVPTHIKQLRTTAPKDMKAAKEQRATGRAMAKEKRKNAKLVPQVAKPAPREV